MTLLLAAPFFQSTLLKAQLTAETFSNWRVGDTGYTDINQGPGGTDKGNLTPNTFRHNGRDYSIVHLISRVTNSTRDLEILIQRYDKTAMTDT